MKRRSAFTLLEALVVLTLLAILASVTVPRMSRSIGQQELREAAGRLAQAARTVRDLAISQRRPAALYIDLDRGGFAVAIAGDRDAGGDYQPVQLAWLKSEQWPAGVKVRQIRTPDGTMKYSGRHQLVFQPDGMSSGGAIRLAGETGECEVLVRSFAGRVIIGEPGAIAVGRDQLDMGD